MLAMKETTIDKVVEELQQQHFQL